MSPAPREPAPSPGAADTASAQPTAHLVPATDTDSPAGASPKRFYGWYIVAATFVILMASSGLGVYGLSVYLHAFIAEGRFAIGEVSVASSLFSVAGGLVGTVVGRLLERFDVRHIITGGALLMAAALSALPLVNSLPALCAFYIVLGVGYSGAALIPCSTLIARWFDQRRAAAMSFSSSGNSFGAMVMVPPAALLIEHQGLNDGGPWLALALLALVLSLAWGVLRDRPADLGLHALGSTGASAPAAHSRAATEADYLRARNSRYFIGLAVAFAMGMAAHVGGQTHLFNLLMQQNASTGFAASAVALMAFSSIAARVVYVRLIGRLGNVGVMVLLLVVQGLALLACGVLTQTRVSPWFMLPAIVLYGSTLGSFITQQSLLLSEAFEVRLYGRLYGFSRVCGVPGVLLGPGLMGWLHQQQGHYLMAYAVVGLLSLAGLLALRAAGAMPHATPIAQPTA